MIKINFKWLSVATIAYIGGAILASSVFTIAVMLFYPEIAASELNIVEPTATIFRLGEALIGFTVALVVARWVCSKTCERHGYTLLAFAAVLTVYGLVSIYLHEPNLFTLTSLGKLCVPWIVAVLAKKWVMSTQR